MTWNNTENHAGAAKMLTYFRVSGFIPAVLYIQCMLQTIKKKRIPFNTFVKPCYAFC